MSSSRAASLDPRTRGGLFVWRAAGFLVAVFLAVLAARFLIKDAIPFITDISPDKFGRFWPRRGWLLTHIAGSGFALLIGPFQFWSGLRRRSMPVHRLTGRLYVVGVVIGGAAAFYLASHAGQGAIFGISLGTLGVAWWTTTGMAYLAIRLGHVSQHKEWVLRSYVVTFTFVTTRALAEFGILPSLGRDPFATLVWLSWSMPLLATEVILQGRKVITRRGAV
ncbi:MAG TPA: DUF2306 domain-containing protein [Vicinamibacterales bacterium]|nr:DUF2306 domain-containing protein [Vicinamibacterales bacterium]